MSSVDLICAFQAHKSIPIGSHQSGKPTLRAQKTEISNKIIPFNEFWHIKCYDDNSEFHSYDLKRNEGAPDFHSEMFKTAIKY